MSITIGLGFLFGNCQNLKFQGFTFHRSEGEFATARQGDREFFILKSKIKGFYRLCPKEGRSIRLDRCIGLRSED